MTLDRPVSPDPYDPLPSFTVVHRRQRRRRGGPAARRRPGRHRGEHLPAAGLSGAPEGTRSYTVTCFDPDAPTPSGFWHWVLVDLPADVTGLEAGAGAGDQVHRYYFVVHAVQEESLGVDSDATPAVVSFSVAFTSIGRAILQGTYQL